MPLKIKNAINILKLVICFITTVNFSMTEGATMPVIHFTNGQILRHHTFTKGDLWVRDGMIIPPQTKADKVVDLNGRLVVPGYVDLQINGAFGHDFTSEPQSIPDVARLLPMYGVTAFCPTIITAPSEVYHNAKDQQKRKEGSAMNLGLHFEGPFISPNAHGTHPKELIQPPPLSVQELSSFYGGFEGLRLVTLSPESRHSLTLIQELKKKGVVVSLGHSVSTTEEVNEAIEAGASCVTHLFNAMRFHHRDPGLWAAALARDDCTFSVIADGVHSHPKTVKIAWKANKENFFLVSDAMAGLGLEDGDYQLGEENVIVKNGKALNAVSGKLAGSTLSMDQAVKNLINFTGCSIAEAVEAASLTPARAIGMDDRMGRLEDGYLANFNVLSKDLDVVECYIKGKRYNSGYKESVEH